jgi:glycosyltransferase involved in cell wall biosynthesis
MVPVASRGHILIRVAFTLIGDGAWTGGVQYLRNLLYAIVTHCPERISPVLFVGDEVLETTFSELLTLPGVTVVRNSAFAARRRQRSLLRAMATGIDGAASRAWSAHGIGVIFEAARFFGARVSQPSMAWIPDFQHRHLPSLFSVAARLKREFGFWTQVRTGRHIVLSSEDARADCERFYPATAGRTHVLRFSVPTPPPVAPDVATAIARGYGLPNEFFYMPNQFWRHKNHSLVIDALALLKARGRDDIVVVASGKPFDPRAPKHVAGLQARIASLGLESQFRILGLIPRPHLAALSRASVAILNPSLFEGWSTTVEEARAQGTPLLLSDLAVHREQAADIAAFFERHSAESLANALVNFPVWDTAERNRAENAARAAAPKRLAAFAKDFAAIVESLPGVS